MQYKANEMADLDIRTEESPKRQKEVALVNAAMHKEEFLIEMREKAKEYMRVNYPRLWGDVDKNDGTLKGIMEYIGSNLNEIAVSYAGGKLTVDEAYSEARQLIIEENLKPAIDAYKSVLRDANELMSKEQDYAGSVDAGTVEKLHPRYADTMLHGLLGTAADAFSAYENGKLSDAELLASVNQGLIVTKSYTTMLERNFVEIMVQILFAKEPEMSIKFESLLRKVEEAKEALNPSRQSEYYEKAASSKNKLTH